MLFLLLACLRPLTDGGCDDADLDGDGFTVDECGPLPGGDCDDDDPTTFPGAPEECDGVDRDCDGFNGNFDGDGDGFAACGDCDDDDPSRNPGAEETCDGVDQDCDGLVDNDPVDGQPYAVDEDNDGYAALEPVQLCEEPLNVPEEGGDCDDANSSINPGAVDVCDDLDNDCDGAVDEGEGTWFADEDEDGFGAGEPIEGCEQPEGTVSNDEDCDDGDDAIHPGADEYCNGVDDDCDDTIDEPTALDASIWYLDGDGDEYGQTSVTTTACEQPEGFAALPEDCDDTDDEVYPGSHEIETPYDGVDTDCDGNDFCTDLNCDAWPDIVVTSISNGSTYNLTSTIFWGSSAGYSANDSTGLTTYGAFTVKSSDLNGDGYPDLVFSGFGSDSTPANASRIWWNSPNGFQQSRVLQSWGAVDVCVEDLTGNGWDDIVLTSWLDGNDHNTKTVVHYNSGNGLFPTRKELGHRGAYHCLTEDLDADGYPELIIGELTREADPNHPWTDEQKIKVYTGSSTGYGSDKVEWHTTGPRHGTVTDLDGDGELDLIYAEHYDGINLNIHSKIWYSFDDEEEVTLPTRGATSVVAEDLDGDGWTDLAFSNLQSDTGYAPDSFVYWGSSSGYGTSNRSSLPTNGAAWVTAEDLDTDGYPELIFSNYYDGTGYDTDSMVYWGSSSGYATGNRTNLPTVGAFRHATHDLDGDGYAEILFAGVRSDTYGDAKSRMFIYWGSSAGYSSTDVTSLNIIPSPGVPLVVGP